ncbi:MAG: serine/threonine protein phosphatase [Hymenobacter sp.]|nr:MAG: serine/threonine protein phosphatase [Hymenobacter sp.]
MNFFVIADIHGCLHTFSELLTHWRPGEEILVQLGDLVDRGNFSPETVSLCRQLSLDFAERTVFLQGNHDWAMAEHLGPNGPYKSWLNWGGRGTLQQYQRHREWLAPHAAWLATRPLSWENEHLLFSHAGFGHDVLQPLDPNAFDSVLWLRDPLRNTGQLQVVGHTPTTDGQLRYDQAANAIYLDTGAVFGRCLTGLRLSETGQVLETVTVATHRQDLA